MVSADNPVLVDERGKIISDPTVDLREKAAEEEVQEETRPKEVRVETIDTGSTLLGEEFYVELSSMSGKIVGFHSVRKALNWLTMRAYHENPMAAGAAALHMRLKQRRTMATIQGKLQLFEGIFDNIQGNESNNRVWNSTNKPADVITDLLEGLRDFAFMNDVVTTVDNFLEVVDDTRAIEDTDDEPSERSEALAGLRTALIVCLEDFDLPIGQQISQDS